MSKYVKRVVISVFFILSLSVLLIREYYPSAYYAFDKACSPYRPYSGVHILQQVHQVNLHIDGPKETIEDLYCKNPSCAKVNRGLNTSAEDVPSDLQPYQLTKVVYGHLDSFFSLKGRGCIPPQKNTYTSYDDFLSAADKKGTLSILVRVARVKDSAWLVYIDAYRPEKIYNTPFNRFNRQKNSFVSISRRSSKFKCRHSIPISKRLKRSGLSCAVWRSIR